MDDGLRYFRIQEVTRHLCSRGDRQNSAVQPQSLGSHGRDRKIGLVGWQLRDFDFFSYLKEEGNKNGKQ